MAIAYIPNYISRLFRWVGVEWGPQGPPSVILWNWVAVALLVAYVFGVGGRGLDSILLARPGRRDVLWAVGFGIVAILVQMVATMVIVPPSGTVGTILGYSLPVIVSVILPTAITEEILLRGYVIERFEELTGQLWAAVGFSFVVFVTPHVVFFGPLWLVRNGLTVVLLYALYVWRRNLVACMLMHPLGNSSLLIPAPGLAS